MKRHSVLTVLILANVLLVVGLMPASPATATSQAATKSERIPEAAPVRIQTPMASPLDHAPEVTPFAAVYSSRPHEFAANLRRVGCPEETVKDILVAEIGRRYRAQEEELRPTPGDHLPWGWSAKTHEAKIIERRQRSARIAREKEGLLRSALGYDVQMPIPSYAMTMSDQAFDATVEKLSPVKRQAAHMANEQYWTQVEQLRNRTRGFWEKADIEELERIKQERNEIIARLQEESE